MALAVLPSVAQTVEERLATAETAIGNAQTAGTTRGCWSARRWCC
jgi:hypothetical protein